MEGIFVCNGAECKCQFGTTPDKLIADQQDKHFINDNKASKKILITHKDIGTPLEKKTFGSCKFSYPNKPCKVNITEWLEYYQKVTLNANNGNPLFETSKAICAVAGSPCIEITFHGQTAEPNSDNQKKEEKDQDTASQINPLANPNDTPIEVPSKVKARMI
ncbi:MAG: DUF4280 domain-containing protein [Flavobacteriaceae bacterium]|nr:DUF4280 domain-containing protein [Flavobacteriaceae bacterium]